MIMNDNDNEWYNVGAPNMLPAVLCCAEEKENRQCGWAEMSRECFRLLCVALLRLLVHVRVRSSLMSLQTGGSTASCIRLKAARSFGSSQKSSKQRCGDKTAFYLFARHTHTHTHEQKHPEKPLPPSCFNNCSGCIRPEPVLVQSSCFETLKDRRFSLCLSRACHGKIFVFIYKWFSRAPCNSNDVLSQKVQISADFLQCKNVRTLFRSFDENADGTVSQHEFRKGIANLGAKRNGWKRFQKRNAFKLWILSDVLRKQLFDPPLVRSYSSLFNFAKTD